MVTLLCITDSRAIEGMWWAPLLGALQCFLEPYQVSDSMRLELRLSCLVSVQYMLVYLQVFLVNGFVVYLTRAALESALVVCDPSVPLYITLVCMAATSGKSLRYCSVDGHA